MVYTREGRLYLVHIKVRKMIRQHHGLHGYGVMWCEDIHLISSWTTKPLAENSIFGYWFKVLVLPLETGVLFSHPSLFTIEALAFPFT